MKIRLGTVLIAALILSAIAVPVSAHHPVVTGCEQVSFDSSTAWTVTVNPGAHTFGPFSHNGVSGPFSLAAGGYTYLFRDGAGRSKETGSFEVPPCNEPTPTPTSTPSGTPDPTPTPTPSSSPSCEQDCGTPSPSPTSTPSGPLPSPSAHPGCASSGNHVCETPTTTLPPTATTVDAAPGSPVDATFAAFLFLGLVCIVLLLPSVKRTR